MNFIVNQPAAPKMKNVESERRDDVSRIFAFFALFACLAFYSLSANGAAEYQTDKQALATLRRDFKNPPPLEVGENLVYEVRYSRFPLYVTVGIVTFDYLGPAANKPASESQNNGDQGAPLIKGLNVEYNPAPDDRFLRLRATAVSKGILISLLGIDVQDRFETLVDANDFSARLNVKEIKEGKKNSIESSVFDRASQQVKYLITDLNNPQAPPRAKFLPHQDGMMSLLSAFYFVRLQKYKEGETIRFPVSADEQNYQFDIVVGKREKLKTDCGKVKTVRLEPKLFGPGQLISRQGEMTMWVTDDKRHTPLRLIAKTSAGTITARLTNFKKNCKIEDAETEESQK
jgi:hypothetical protein